MKKNADLSPSNQAGEIHQRAEKLQFQRESRVTNPLIHTDPQRLIHELQVNLIELEMQNEELLQIHARLEAAHARYVDLFDFAPVGYLTLNELGVIQEANLTAAAMLGVARRDLIRDRLTRFILPECGSTYSQNIQQLFSSGTPQACELYIIKNNAIPFWARLETNLVQDKVHGTPIIHIVISDIGTSKNAEKAMDVHEFINVEQDQQLLQKSYQQMFK